MNIELFNQMVLIKEDDRTTRTKSGLYIPDDAKQEKTNVGTVVATGPGTEKVPMIVSEGDRVFFDKYAGTKFKFQGTEYLLMKMETIYGKVLDTDEKDTTSE